MQFLNPIFITFIYFTLQYLAYSSIFSLLTKTDVETNKKMLVSFLLAFISTTLQLLPTLSFSILNVFSILLFLISSTILFKANTTTSLFTAIVCSCISSATNIICFSFNILPNNNYYIAFNALILAFLTLFFYNYLYTHDIPNIIHEQQKLITNSSELQLFLLLLTTSYNLCDMPTIELSYISLLIQICTILLLFHTIKEKVLFDTMKVSLETRSSEYENLKSIVDNIRVFKHDYSNILCSIGGYISLNDMSGLKNFYNKLTTEFNNTNNLQKITTTTINEPSIYNLLVSKHNIIQQNNLKFDFYSAINYKQLAICPYDFSKILGIFLDNAIDAANLSAEKEISLSCEMNKNKDFLITVKNSYINKDVDIDKIYLKGYSSKNIKSGLGLWEVSKIIKSLPNISLDTNKDETYFTQKLTIYSLD